MKLRVFFLAALAAAISFGSAAQSQTPYPSRPIKIVVPFPPGGPSDILARLMAQAMGNRLPQPVIVENRPGGSAAVGGQAVAQSEPDGYTLLQFDITQVLLPNLRTDMPYDWTKAFTPIFGMHEVPMLLVTTPDASINQVKDLIAADKKGAMNYASGGNGSLSHILGVRFAKSVGLQSNHIPYKGLADATVAVRSGGESKFAFISPSDGLSFIQAGTLKPLATTGSERLAKLPDVPTLKEQGINIVANLWINAFVVPAGTPEPIIETLRKTLKESANDPIVQDKAVALGMHLKEMQGAELKAFAQEQMAQWGKVIKDNNITIGQ